MRDNLVPSEDSIDHSTHYLRTLTTMAQRRKVTAQEAIFSVNGIKLVDKGARIDSRMHDRLVQHKLREPVDMHLTVEDAVTSAFLRQQADHLLLHADLPRLLAQSLGGTARLSAPLKTLSLTPRIAFRLTVMREELPELFTHSLQVMLTAQYLALVSRMADEDCNRLAAAALLHDLGVLHMDPLWRDPDRKVTGAERRHLVAHPITAMLLVRDAGIYGPRVETAILEHHERMDGTGYPRGLSGNDISPLGQVLLMAELVAALAEKHPDTAFEQLSLVLRLNHRKFPKALAEHTLALLSAAGHADKPPPPPPPPTEPLRPLVLHLVQAFGQWKQAKAQLDGTGDATGKSGPAAFVEERLHLLERALAEAGMQTAESESLPDDDGADLSELSFVVREALWQLTSIVNGCERRWPTELQQRTDPQASAVGQWCDWVRGIPRA
ncbi:HD-GYP domain-containing protein [Comamonas badia]|uniref:HD-GYP domain-containing protein n=1 Tax=Comamonas badia TaxID=265291 RepID=UPI0004291C81|nr:HD domain-containing phosphohydrolase [Comamonas badia]